MRMNKKMVLIGLLLIVFSVVLSSGCIQSGDLQAPGDQGTGLVTGLTQEDLDELRAELEGMEFEDLGGLSNE